MKDTISYSEFLFLSALEKRDQRFEFIYINNQEQQNYLGFHQILYQEMVATLAEDMYIVFENPEMQLLVGRLRGEISPRFSKPMRFFDYQWENPRDALNQILMGPHPQRVRVTYRGLRRLEELRELLKRDRTLEPFGVLLDLRYFIRDLKEALQRSTDVPVSVLCLDLDGFKKINDEFGHAAGDVVMKAYLEAVQDSVGSFGSAYRGRGDEVAVLLVGLNDKRARESAEKIRVSVEGMRCKFKEMSLPPVTTSIGVATTPPEPRSEDIETLADDRQIRAKKEGKNRVLSS